MFDILPKGGVPFDHTIDMQKVLGKRMISKNGLLVGRVSQVRLARDGFGVEGALVSRGFFSAKLFIGVGYFDRLTEDSIVLKIDPFLLSKGLKIVSSEGEVVGKVIDFVRTGNSNDLDALIVKGFMRGTFNVPISSVKSVGYSIILKPNYEFPKKHFWKGN